MESYLHQIQSANGLKNNKFLRLVVAGIVATLAFNAIMYSDIAITGIPLDIPSTLGQMFVGESSYAKLTGHFIHIINGVGLALLFGYVVVPISRKISKQSFVIYAVVFAIVETVIGVWFVMLPALGAGFAGLEIGILVPAITLIRHVVFGLVLGVIAKQRGNDIQ